MMYNIREGLWSSSVDLTIDFNLNLMDALGHMLTPVGPVCCQFLSFPGNVHVLQIFGGGGN